EREPVAASLCRGATRRQSAVATKLCASRRSALRVETKSQRRARLDEATSTTHSPRARRPRSPPKRAVCVYPSKSCHKPSRAARAIATESATDRHGSSRPEWYSRQDRHLRFEIETRF